MSDKPGNFFDQFDDPTTTKRIEQREGKGAADIVQSGASTNKTNVDANRTTLLTPAEVAKANADAIIAAGKAPFAAREAAANVSKAEGDARAAVAAADKAERDSQTPAQMVAFAKAQVLRGIRAYRKDIQGQPASRAFGYAEGFDAPSAFGLIPALPSAEAFTTLNGTILPAVRPIVARFASEGSSDMEMLVFERFLPKAGDSDKTIEVKYAALDTLLSALADRKLPSEVVSTGIGERGIDDVERDILRFVSESRPTGPRTPANLLPEFAPEQPAGRPDAPGMPDVWRQGNAPVDVRPGDKNFTAETDLRIAAQLQEAFDNGASADDMQKLARELYAATGAPARLDEGNLRSSIEYRDQFLRNGGVGPSGATVAPRESPMTPKQQSDASSLESAPKAFLREAGDALTVGAAPVVTELFNPELAQSMRFTRERMREASPVASLIGDIAGSAAPTAGLTTLGARYGLKPATAALLSDVAYSTTRGAAESGPTGGLVGGTTALLGGYLGNKVLGGSLEALTRRYMPGAPAKPSKVDSLLLNETGDIATAEARLREATRLGLPYGLADTTTEAQQLASRSARAGQQASAVAENTYPERLAGRVDRAGDAIDHYIAPHITDVRAREEDIRAAAQRAAGPEYDKAFAQPVVKDRAIESMLETQYGRAGLKRVLADMEAQGLDPYETGIVVNSQGNPVAQKELSWETLHRVREGVSREIDNFRDPITRQTSRDAEPWKTFLNRLDSRLDDLNPNYKTARALYHKNIEPMDFLHNGLSAAGGKVPPADVERTLARINKMPAGTPEEVALRDAALANYREGYATSLRSSIDNRAQGTDAYAAVAGTRRQQEKLRLIGTDPDTFTKQLAAENRMALTSTATADAPAAHASGDAQQGLEGTNLIDIAGAVLPGTYGSGLGTVAHNIMYRPSTWSRLTGKLGYGPEGRAKRTADAAASELMGTDPDATLRALLARQKSAQDYTAFAQPLRAAGAVAGGTLAGVTGRQAPDEAEPYNAPRPLDQNLLVAGAFGQGAKINPDGSVTLPNGGTVDAGAAKQQIGDLASSLSHYYEKPSAAPAPQASEAPAPDLSALQERYPQAAPATRRW